ncbi:21076_t:CDS:2, partial [Racocetra persica]
KLEQTKLDNDLNINSIIEKGSSKNYFKRKKEENQEPRKKAKVDSSFYDTQLRSLSSSYYIWGNFVNYFDIQLCYFCKEYLKHESYTDQERRREPA